MGDSGQACLKSALKSEKELTEKSLGKSMPGRGEQHMQRS